MSGEAPGIINFPPIVFDAKIPGYGPVTFVNRLVRTRMPGDVGRAEENPPLPDWAINPFRVVS